MMKIFYILLFLLLVNQVLSVPIFEGVKKALNLGWKKMPESERVNNQLIQEAQLNDRNRRATWATQSAEQARAAGDHVGAKEFENYSLQRQTSAKRIEGSIELLDSNKPLRIKKGMSGGLHITKFKPRKGIKIFSK